MDWPALGIWEDAGREPYVRSGLLRIFFPSEGVGVSLCGLQSARERPTRTGCGSEGARPGVHFGDHQRSGRGYFDHKRIKKRISITVVKSATHFRGRRKCVPGQGSHRDLLELPPAIWGRQWRLWTLVPDGRWQTTAKRSGTSGHWGCG